MRCSFCPSVDKEPGGIYTEAINRKHGPVSAKQHTLALKGPHEGQKFS